MKGAIGGWMMGIALLVAVWALGSAVAPSRVVASPTEAASRLWSDKRLHLLNTAQTAWEATLGLATAVSVAVLLVTIIAIAPTAATIVYPAVTVLKAAPVVAFVPVLVFVAGTGTACKAAVAALIAFFPMVIGGIDGLRSRPTALVVMSDAYGSSRIGRVIGVDVAYVAAGMTIGLKTAAPLSVVGAIVGEYVAGGLPTGLGTFIMSNYAGSHTADVFAGVVLASAIGLAFFAAAQILGSIADRRLHLHE